MFTVEQIDARKTFSKRPVEMLLQVVEQPGVFSAMIVLIYPEQVITNVYIRRKLEVSSD